MLTLFGMTLGLDGCESWFPVQRAKQGICLQITGDHTSFLFINVKKGYNYDMNIKISIK